MSEQRYQAVLAVIAVGETVTDVAARFGVSRKTVHAWLNKYEAGGLEALGDGSHRPRSCPHQMPAVVEVALVEMRRAHPSWGPKRLVFELGKAGVEPVPSESGVYRALTRLGLIDPAARRPRDRKFKRWERGAPMELWQMDVVGGFVLADGRRAKALTGIDDHSRFCVSAYLMLRESSHRVCEGLALAMQRYGVPSQVLTDNGKVFTGRFNRPPVEVLFDRVLRENGVEHLLTQPRSPTTTGKVERFHRALRTEFRTDRVFESFEAAQAELDAWVEDYNHARPHQALDMAAPASRFLHEQPAPVAPLRRPVLDVRPPATRGGGDWVARRASRIGVVCVHWQQVALGQAAAGKDIDVWVTDQVLQFWDGDTLLRTQARKNPGEPVRKKRASIPGGRGTLNPGPIDPMGGGCTVETLDPVERSAGDHCDRVREATVMTTPRSHALPLPGRAPLRLTLAPGPTRGNLGGAWWPQSRDLELELADLVDGFPTDRGRVMRGVFSRPDWDQAPRRITTKRGIMKVGSFPSDDTHTMILSMSTQPGRLCLLVIPSDTDEDTAQALMAAAPSTDTHSVAALLARHNVS